MRIFGRGERLFKLMDGHFGHGPYELCKAVTICDVSGTLGPVDGFRGNLAQSLGPKDLRVWIDVYTSRRD